MNRRPDATVPARPMQTTVVQKRVTARRLRRVGHLIAGWFPSRKTLVGF